MTEVTIISVFLFALVIGFMIGRRFPSNKQAAKFEQQVTEQQQQLNDYQTQLSACQSELKQQAAEQSKYQQQVSTHFAKTADLMDSIAQQYQTLYQHMSTDAAQLLPAEEASRSISIFKRNKHEPETAQLTDTTTLAAERSPEQEQQDEEPTEASTTTKAASIESEQPENSEETKQEPLEPRAKEPQPSGLDATSDDQKPEQETQDKNK
ncbi:YhcB family protein [Motilimonas sp. KMU-193]|uniref:YhcB family protein n=1 Tax=Motilimonas sp. KMU-193 TaxID=3388668 RepID=UPI00396B0285